MIQGIQKSFGFVAAVISVTALMSCAPAQNNTHDQRQAVMDPTYDMARPRGLNTEAMLTNDLNMLVEQTQVIQSQIDYLMRKLESLQGQILAYNARERVAAPLVETPPLSIVPVKDTPKPVKVVKTKPVPRAPEVQTTASSAEGVVGLRIGRHNDKTRLVLDVNGSTYNTYDFDKEAGILTVTMPQTGWSADKSKVYTLNQISGYQAKTADKGTVIAMTVKNTSAVKVTTIKATQGKPARLVIDLIK